MQSTNTYQNPGSKCTQCNGHTRETLKGVTWHATSSGTKYRQTYRSWKPRNQKQCARAKHTLSNQAGMDFLPERPSAITGNEQLESAQTTIHWQIISQSISLSMTWCTMLFMLSLFIIVWASTSMPSLLNARYCKTTSKYICSAYWSPGTYFRYLGKLYAQKVTSVTI